MAKSNRPDKYPIWASKPIKDDITGELNIYEPPEHKKDIGWEYKEVPPRQWVNWQSNLIGSWIEYLDYHLNKPTEYTKANLPSPANNKAKLIYVTDIDSGTLAYSDGVNWKKIKTEGII